MNSIKVYVCVWSCEMAVALNRSTRVLIDNFIDKHFQGKDKAIIKQEAFEIADLS